MQGRLGAFSVVLQSILRHTHKASSRTGYCVNLITRQTGSHVIAVLLRRDSSVVHRAAAVSPCVPEQLVLYAGVIGGAPITMGR